MRESHCCIHIEEKTHFLNFEEIFTKGPVALSEYVLDSEKNTGIKTMSGMFKVRAYLRK